MAGWYLFAYSIKYVQVRQVYTYTDKERDVNDV